MKRMKRFLCLLLALVMVLGYIPGAVETAAAQEDGLCEVHHPEHDARCGYQAPSDCTHIAHDDTCDYAGQIAAVPVCECPVGEDGVTVIHGEDCTYEDQLAAVVCNHVHGDCGYAEEVPCAYAGGCPDCLQAQKEEENQPDAQDEENNTGLEIQDCHPDPNAPNILYLSMTFNGEPITSADNLSMAPAEGDRNVASVSYDEASGCVKVEFWVVNVPMNIVYTDADGMRYEQRLIWEAEESFFAVLDAGTNEIHNSLTLDAVGEALKVKFYYGAQYPVQVNNYTPLTNVEIGDPSGTISMTGPDMEGWFTITALKEGSTGVVHFVNGEAQVIDVTVGQQQSQEPVRLLACRPEGNPNTVNTRQLVVGTEMALRCFWAPMNGGPWSDSPILDARSDNPEVFTLSDSDPVTGVYTLKALKEGQANIVAVRNGQEYTWSVAVINQPVYYLLVTPSDSSNFMSLEGLTIDQPYYVKCYYTYAGPNSGYPITSGLAAEDTSVLEVSGPDAAGVYTLTPKKGGATVLTYTPEMGEPVSQRVTVMGSVEELEGDYLYYPALHGQSGTTYPKTVVNMRAGDSMSQEFYFGNTRLSLDTPGFSYSGPIKVEQFENDPALQITATGAGTGYLEYTADGITHCFVVNVGRPAPNTEIVEGGYMWLDEDVVLGFGNPFTRPAGMEGDGYLKLISQASGAYGYDTSDTSLMRVPVAFAAMDHTGGSVVDDIMAQVENVKFTILTCSNSDGSDTPNVTLERENCEQVTLAEGQKAWTNYLLAEGKKGYVGLVGMTFDLEDGNKTRRISLYLLTHYTLQRDISVELDISSAAELNVILSSYEALIKYIGENFPGSELQVRQASNVNLILPGGDFTDAVVVSQAIASCPFPGHVAGNPNFRVYIHGNDSGKRTRMAGLISRGSLTSVSNIDFVATNGVTMTRGNEEPFTCGLMADAEWTGYVDYGGADLADFRAEYGDVNGDGNYREMGSGKLSGDFRNLDCDILGVNNCTFTGFDYGVRSTPDGYVGSGFNNSFSNCYYGIYIDCEGKPAWGNIFNSAYGGYDFKKNVVAIRIVGLQELMMPYAFRVQDSDFINNYLEFWIDEYDTTFTQQYYFYRNHYRGGWKLGGGSGNGNSSGYGWVKHEGKAPDDEKLPDVHRGPKYRIQDSNGSALGNGEGAVTISGTPGSSAANLSANAVSRSSSEGYWIYDGEDQVTLIEKGGDILPLAQESLESLTQDADVSVVTNKGTDTVAVWTFEGGE